MEYSRKYWMELVNKVNIAIWKEYIHYKDVEFYIQKRHVVEWDIFSAKSNFNIIRKRDWNIDSYATLHSIKDFDLLLKIAIDLWVETPWFIPAVSYIKNELKDDNKNVYDTFMKAFKNVSDSPDDAVGFANSALESIIKTILQDDRIVINKNNNDTLYELSEKILKVLKKYPWKDMPEEINMIGSWLLKTSQWIEKLRSDKTDFHWKTKNDVVIKDSSYAYFIVNVVTTIGLFLSEVYKENYPKQKKFDPNDLPF